MKFFMSEQEQERQTTFWKWQDFCDYFHWNFTSKIMLTNMNAANYTKNQNDLIVSHV